MSARPAPQGRVRSAAAPDLARLTALWRALAADHAAFDPALGVRDADGLPLGELLRRWLEHPERGLLVWEREGRLGGLCIVRVRHAPALAAEARRGEIEDLYVEPALRRRGVGRALVHAALDWMHARRVERVEVRVAAGNEAGQAFWRALGFADFVDVLHRRL